MTPRLTRLELALAAAIFAIGFGLRAAYPSRMAVEHFDEGVYASNLYTPDGRYPFQHLYAPPLLPFCLEMAAIVGGPQAVMWVNVVSGSLTLLVLWGMVRAWWGPPAAMAAMVLLAFNEFHIAYSRAALTDAMLGLWMTAGVWAGWRAIQLGGPVNILAAGVLAALAWWTKYNGWLTLAITGAGTAGWILFGDARATLASGGRQPPVDPPASSKNASRRKTTAGSRPPLADAPKSDTVFGAACIYLGRWGLTAAIAFLLWSPWLWELQQYGGYAAVAENHQKYFSGFGGWWRNAVQQFAAFSHTVRLSTAVGFIVSLNLPIFFAARTEDRPGGSIRPLGAAAWLAAAWLIGLVVAVPLYHPYPRLLLPLVIAVALAIAGFVALALHGLARRAIPWGAEKQFAPWIVAIALALAAFVVVGLRGVSGWRSRTALQGIAGEIISRIKQEPIGASGNGPRSIISVVGQPGLFFHLAAAQGDSPIDHVTLPAASVESAVAGNVPEGIQTYLVIDSRLDGAETRALVKSKEPLASFDYAPSDLVLLDDRPAWKLFDGRPPVVFKLSLFHVQRD